MRLLITGSRDLTAYRQVRDLLDAIHGQHRVRALAQGEAHGADRIGYAWSWLRRVPQSGYPADWSRYGRGAGPIRNEWMVTDFRPDGAVAFPLGESAGTRGCMALLQERSIPVLEVDVLSPSRIVRPGDDEIAAWLGLVAGRQAA